MFEGGRTPVTQSEGPWTMASLDQLGDPVELEAQARRELLEMGGDVAQPSSHIEGADRTSTIWVTIDTDGRVAGIEINRSWKDRLDAGAVAGALLEAYNNAQAKSIQARAAKALTAHIEGRPRREARAAVPVDIGPSPHDDPERWLRETMDDINTLTAQVQAIERGETGLPVETEAVVRSPNGLFTLRHQGRQVTEITGEIMQIRRTDAESLRLEALDLFKAAGLIAGAGGASAAPPAATPAASAASAPAKYEDEEVDFRRFGGGY
jgi:hypothetical protein